MNWITQKPSGTRRRKPASRTYPSCRICREPGPRDVSPGRRHRPRFGVSSGPRNVGTGIGFLTRLRLVAGKDQAEILPVFWDDNYISLLPGEKPEVLVRVRESDLAGALPSLLADGFNVTIASVHVLKK
jgi:Exo-beta-D-glucosaminidase Ig-fold domain